MCARMTTAPLTTIPVLQREVEWGNPAGRAGCGAEVSVPKVEFDVV